MEEKEKIIMLFSGGKDSFLATCLLIEAGFNVHMVCFETFAGLAGDNARYGAMRIISRYGEDCANFLGVYPNVGFWREFILPFLNMKPSEILEQYGELTVSQFNCLTCRSAMYVWTIIKAKEMSIQKVADGARKSQGFVIELPCMLEQFQNFFKGFGLELLFPVSNLDNDWHLKNLLLTKGFVPKVIEPQCLIGAPLPSGGELEEVIQRAVVTYFNDVIVPRARNIINDSDFKVAKKGELL